jgi:hypothetical protein
MKELIGKTISGIRVNEDQSVLIFDHPNGTTTGYVAEGDCCSETWFADITGVAALLGGTVAEVEQVEMEAVEDGRTRQEWDLFYGVKLRTDKGFADIVYRNSSNGYYGGWIHPMPTEYRNDTTKITDDWSA